MNTYFEVIDVVTKYAKLKMFFEVFSSSILLGNG